MSDLLLYLIKVNVALVLFFLGYHFWLGKLTFYNLNRLYLIFALLFSAAYPLIPFGSWLASSQEAPATLLVTLSDWQQLPLYRETNRPGSFVVIYWFSVGICCLLFLIKLLGIGRIHVASVPNQWNQYVYRRTKENLSPFSFLNQIYFNPALYAESAYEKIFRHEQVHVMHWHSLDILLAEVALLFFWYNPFCWLIRKAIQDNIEFITDRKVLSQGMDKKSYQYSLVQIATLSPPSQIGIPFNFKNLKKRITMMNKQQSSTVELGKYVFIVPAVVLGSLVLGVSKAYDGPQLSWDASDHIIAENQINMASYAPDTNELVNEITAKSDNNKKPEGIPVTSATKTMAGNSLNLQNDPNMEDRNAIATAAATHGPSEAIESITARADTGSLGFNGTKAPDEVMTIQPQSGNNLQPRTGKPEPLYIVDGVRQKILTIEPEEIGAIHVLKGEATTAEYGDEGKNGVLLITTKSKSRVDGETASERVLIETNTTEPLGKKPLSTANFSLKPENENILVIIDGQRSPRSSLDRVNPSDIASVTVLKGDHAAQLYGNEGREGVVEIITKK